MKTPTLTPAEITETGFRILLRELGPVNAVRFINQFSNGFGDYTAERADALPERTMDQIMADIERRRVEKTQKPTPVPTP